MTQDKEKNSRFGEDYTPAKIAAWVDAADHDAKQLLRKSDFDPALIAEFRRLREAGRLRPIEGLANRQCWQADCWNGFVAGDDAMRNVDYMLAEMCQAIFMEAVVYEWSHLQSKVGSPELEQSLHEFCVAAIAKGDTHAILSPAKFFDRATGSTLEIHFQDWRPIGVERDWNLKSGPLVDAEPVASPDHVIDMPTGRILVSDTFDLEGFEEASFPGYGDEFAPGNDRGEAAATRRLAEDLGYAETHARNGGVAVFRNPEGTRILLLDKWANGTAVDPDDGEEYEDMLDVEVDGFKHVGNISCQRWAAIVIDEAALLEVMRRGGSTDPEKALSEERAKRSRSRLQSETVSLEVEPGRWRMRCGPNFGITAADVGAKPPGARVWMTLDLVEKAGA
jgi:hypothetical protein